MSQADAAVAVSSEQVRNAVSNLVDRERNMLANLEAVSSSVMTAADYLSVLGDKEKVATYKDLVCNLGKLSHEVRAHQDVLVQLGQSYQASLDDTDFKAVLDQRLQDQLQRSPYDPRSDKHLKDFMEMVNPGGGVGTFGAGGEGGDDDLGDEDLELCDGGRSWVNDTCPLSMKKVLDLDRPVKDLLGYVYEHTSIMDYLRGMPGGSKHPVAGVPANTLLRAADLKPAEDVIRAKRRQRLFEAMGGGAAGGSDAAGNGPDEDVIDV